MRQRGLGEQESVVLKWVAEHAPVSVSEAAGQFGASQGLARTTLLTVMERLRQKSYLRREKIEGIYRYSPSQPHEIQLRGLVQRFVERSLGGSLDPFVAYITHEADLTVEQIEQLRGLVKGLDAEDAAAQPAQRKRKRKKTS